jgi:hypothetical protein
MDTIALPDIIIILLGVAAMYTPRFQLAKSEKLTGRELGKTYPKYQWMRWGFIILYTTWIVLVFTLFFSILASSWVQSPCVLGGLFASIGLFIGSFAMITRVCLVPTRAPRLLYVVGDEAFRAGRFQVLWSVAIIVVCTVASLIE